MIDTKTEYGFNEYDIDNCSEAFYMCLHNVRDAFNSFSALSILSELDYSTREEIREALYHTK